MVHPQLTNSPSHSRSFHFHQASRDHYPHLIQILRLHPNPAKSLPGHPYLYSETCMPHLLADETYLEIESYSYHFD